MGSRDAAATPDHAGRPRRPDVDASTFAQLDLRVGRVVGARPSPHARRPALVVDVDFGASVGTLRTSARITSYAPESLPGRQVVGVLNLGARRIAGVDSQFLLLGAVDAGGEVHLLGADAPVAPGTPVA